MEKRLIYQIFFSPETQAYVSPLAVGVDNTWYEGKPYMPALENHIICHLAKNEDFKNADRVGILSWAFENKNKYKLADLAPSYEEDVVYVRSPFAVFDMWGLADTSHPGIIALSNIIFQKIGKQIDFTKQPKHVIYENAHLTKPSVYQHYIQDWLNPVMSILFDLDDTPVQRLVNLNSGYKSWAGGYNPEEVKKVMGLPYYTFHAFVCERLFSLFLEENPNYTVRALEGK